MDWLGWSKDELLVTRLNKGNGVFATQQALIGDIHAITQRKQHFSKGGGDYDIRWVPKYSAAFKFHDINGDGKAELLMPSARILKGCAKVGTGRPTPHWEVRCGEELYGTYYESQNIESKVSIDSVKADQSIYQFSALSFDVEANGDIRVTQSSTNLIGHAYQSRIVDAYGNGLPTMIFNHRKYGDYSFDGDASGTAFEGFEESYGVYINRSFGAGSGNSHDDYIPRDLIESVDNGLGVTSEWQYKPLATGDGSALQDKMYSVDQSYAEHGYFHFASSMYVVKDFAQSNGIGGENITEYAYKGAMYNTQGRGFMGFRTILEYNQTQDSITHTDFLQKFPYQSKVQYQATFKGDNYPDNIQTLADDTSEQYISFTENTWAINDEHSQANGSPVTHCYFDAEMRQNYCVTEQGSNAVQHVYLSSSQSITRDITTHDEIQSTTVNNTDIDACGNVTSTSKSQQDDWGAYQQTLTTDTLEASCDNTGVWWPHKVSSKTIKQHEVTRTNIDDAFTLYGGNSSTLDNDVTVTTTYEYGHSNVRKPTIQRITTPNDSQTNTSVTTITYNDYGLPTEQFLSGKVNNVDTTRTISQITYSKDGLTQATSGDGYFPWQLDNALGHRVKTQTDITTGQPLTVSRQLQGNNYLDTTYAYDALGRLLTTTAENTTPMEMRYSLVDSTTDSLAPEHAKSRVSKYQTGYPTQRVYLDSIGREIRTAVIGYSGNWHIGDKHFDSLGHLIYESVPRPSDASADSHGVSYSGFDVLGRPSTKITAQVCGTLTTTYSYSGLTTDITAVDNCAGGNTLTLSRTYNSQKQLMKTLDADQGVTRYAYNSLGLPIVIRDASNTDAGSIIAQYNSLGRKTYVNDPNQGLTTFTYNGFGELARQVQNSDTTSAVTITHQYDDLGRMIQRSATGEGTSIYQYLSLIHI